MNEIDPMEMLDDILQRLEAYHPEIETKQDDDISIRLVHGGGKELFIDLDDEFSIFFGDWHCHYSPYNYDYNRYADEYQEFLSDLFDILENRQYTVCTYRENEWNGSWLEDGKIPDIDKIRKDIGADGIKVVCSFWDSEKDIVFQT
ncbi:MAG TPA: hypothetical protein DCO72_11310 [Ruminococcus sp.]|nr:hypothetical protein [Ruminococcus sp.]